MSSSFPSPSLRPADARGRGPRLADPRAALDELGALAHEWRSRVETARLRVRLVTGLLVLFGALLVARRGTLSLRLAALSAIVSVAAVAVAAWTRDRALWRDPSQTIATLAGKLDAERAARAIRALGLLPGGAGVGTSGDLAALHVSRVLRALPRKEILDRALRLAMRYRWLTASLVVVALVVAATRGVDIFEGADVLLARHGAGPFPMPWMASLDIDARPPEYLHERDLSAEPYDATPLPRGSLLTFRGSPLHPGRRLLLTDGKVDVAFVDDGTGRLVARWLLADSVSLKVVARFGDVTISERDATSFLSVEDESPVVNLEGAPRVLRVADVGVGATIPIKYDATDDHGLREVDLVLRSGAREERRILARLDGDTASSRGGQVLRASDPFLKKSHAATEIRVEAEDNDAVTGPKWGKSEAITIIPPEAGEPEALRMDVLRTLRDGFVDSLGALVERDFAVATPLRAPLADKDREAVAADDRLLDTAAKATPAGLPVSPRHVALLRGQMRRVKEALNAELHSPGVASHARLVAATERLVLVTDAVVRGLAQTDARKVARSLAEVADDLSLGASQMRRSEDRARGQLRADASVVVLEGGGRSLQRLGSLGRDLGEIVQMDLARVARARDQDDVVHAEIAAADLAARLRDPDPSFGAQGSSGGRAGGESGGGRGTAGGAGEGGDDADDAERAFDEAAREVDQLASDHAQQIERVEQLMGDDDTRGHAGSEEAKGHAKAIRDATKGLPSVGAGSDSWTNKGAAAREHAEAMARALEDGDTGSAVSSGRSALDALDEAKHVAQRERWTGLLSAQEAADQQGTTEQRLDSARGKLEPELAWAAQSLKNARKQAALGKLADLSAHGEQEDRLAERAESVRERGEGRGALPGPAIEALHQAERAAEEAASALKRGDVDEGLARQREAQRRLESAKEALGGGETGEGGDDGRSGDDTRAGHADIPGASAHKGPDEFRRRVVEGLAEGAVARQRDAIQRYADGLLR